MRLAEIQQALAASLGSGAAPPRGVDPGAHARAARSLEIKRRRAAFRLLPGLRRALGRDWRPRFHRHVQAYRPAGILFHVDDAWAFALEQGSTGSREVRRAAGQDLRALQARFVRRPARAADRIAERVTLTEWLRRRFRR